VKGRKGHASKVRSNTAFASNASSSWNVIRDINAAFIAPQSPFVLVSDSRVRRMKRFSFDASKIQREREREKEN